MKFSEYVEKREEVIVTATKLIDLLRTLEAFTDSKAMEAHDEYTNLLNNYSRTEQERQDIDFWKQHREHMRYENEKYFDTLRLLKRITGADYAHLD